MRADRPDDRSDDDRDIYKGNDSSLHNSLFSVQECSLGIDKLKMSLFVITKPTSLNINRFRSQLFIKYF